MGVGTFLSVTSNWSVVPLAAGPGPWLGQPKDKDASLMNYPQRRRTLPLKFFPFFFSFLSFFLLLLFFEADQHLLSKHRCVLNQSWREKHPARATGRVNMLACQGSAF